MKNIDGKLYKINTSLISRGREDINKVQTEIKEELYKVIYVHKNMNILTPIWYYVETLLLNKTNLNEIYNELDKVKKSILDNKIPDFSKILSLIIENNGESIKYDETYIKLINSVKLLEHNIKNNSSNYKILEISLMEIENIITRNIYSLNYGEIENNINFDFYSYLGDFFSIKPILIELLIDLVHNSIKYSDEGSEIDISIKQQEDRIFISVKDNGYGIKEENIEKIFECGERTDSAYKKEGSGVGLYKLAKEIDKLGGNLYIQSQLGVGTKISFDVKLPFVLNPIS